MAGVNQPNMNPTNKLGAAVAAAALMSVINWLLEAFLPHLPNEDLISGLTPLVVFAAGWFVKDAPTVAVKETRR